MVCKPYLLLPDDQICEMYVNGLSSVKIASKFNCNNKTIIRLLKRNEIKIRKGGMPKNKINNFWEKVKKIKLGCWEWQAFIDPDGYGQYLHTRAHRFSYELHSKKKIPKGMLICHKCDNPKCVNPNHLFVGTIQDNNKDCINKNRHAKGEKSGMAKLTEKDVLKIRKLYKNKIKNQAKLGRIFNVDKSNIRAIVIRKTWKHI